MASHLETQAQSSKILLYRNFKLNHTGSLKRSSPTFKCTSETKELKKTESKIDKLDLKSMIFVRAFFATITYCFRS
jgi:hypothetical protein